MNVNMDRLTHSSQQNSRRSLVSESESDVGSLLSGLSQARKIPDRRKLPSKDNGRGGLRSMTNGNERRATRERPPRDAAKLKQKNDAYKKELPKIIKLQAFARGYMVRFAYQSRLTMEKTKRRFFAIQLQAFMRGFLQRQRYGKTTGKRTSVQRKELRHTHTDRTGLGSPKQNRNKIKDLRRTTSKPNSKGLALDDDSVRSQVSIRMERLMHRPIERRSSFRTADSESQSEVGSIMSNLSRARKVPDRRKKQEEKENKVIKIQALARGYIQRLLYRSMLTMKGTKKKYAAITIQAQMRGYLQRKNGPELSRVHVAPRREPLLAPPKTSYAHPRGEKGSTDSHGKRRNAKKSRRERVLHGKPFKHSRRRDQPQPQKTMRKPVRQRSSDDGEKLLPRQLTIRKPRRQTSDTEEESHDLPVKQLTIRKPRRHHSDSDDSEGVPPRRVLISNLNAGRNRDRNNIHHNGEGSPPRKLMLRTKKGKRPDVDLDRSEESLEPEKAFQGRMDRLVASNNASESKLGESESDVGSLMSGLSQARRVPDRRLKREMPGRRAPQKDEPMNNEKQLPRIKSATKIQAVGRGYIARFSYQSRLILEQTKKKFFAIQIQALARGFIARVKTKKHS